MEKEKVGRTSRMAMGVSLWQKKRKVSEIETKTLNMWRDTHNDVELREKRDEKRK